MTSIALIRVQPVNATGTTSWSSNYSSGQLFVGGTCDNTSCPQPNSGVTCGTCDGTGASMWASSLSSCNLFCSQGGDLGEKLIFEDRTPSGSGEYYTCPSGSNSCGFYVPNYGQGSTTLSISGTFHLLGAIAAGVSDNNEYALATVNVNLNIYQDSTSSLDTPYYAATLLSSEVACGKAQPNVNCPSVTGGGNQGSVTFSSDLSFSNTVILSPGHFYHSGLIFHTHDNSNAGGFLTNSFAAGCFWYKPGGSSNCSGPPSPSSSCPSSLPNPCYYVQWKSASYTLNDPDFGISANPSSLSYIAGNYTSVTTVLTLSSVNAFSTLVQLTASSNDPNFGLSLNPTSLTVPSGGTGNSVLTISDPNSCDAGSYSVTVTGSTSDGTFTTMHSTVIPVTVTRTCDFSMSGTPNSLSIKAGKSGSSTISVTSIKGFSGSVLLSASSPSGITTSISTNPVSVSSGSQATSLLTINVGKSTARGTYTIVVTGAGPYGSHSTGIIVTV